MRIRTRVDRLARAVAGRHPAGVIELIWCAPAGSPSADGRPPGVSLTPDGRSATVVFAGRQPDPAVLAPLQACLAPWGKTVVLSPG